MEIFDLYDDQRHPLGRTMRRGEPVPPGCFHLVADVLFLNAKGETLLQLRSREKANRPNTWSISGGHAIQGEDSAAACQREIREELGIWPDMRKGKVLWTKTSAQQGTIWDVYLFCQDVPAEQMRLQKEEVQTVKWILPELIAKDARLARDLSLLAYWKEIYPYLCLESMRLRIPRGIYRHYKGNRYQVEGLALHSETLEPMVIYKALYGPGETWVRPAAMWNELVTVEGKRVLRFSRET